MKIAIGILLVLLALYFVGVVVRMFPIGVVRAFSLRPTTVLDVLMGIANVLFLGITGAMLLLDASWWFLLINGAIWFVLCVILGRIKSAGALTSITHCQTKAPHVKERIVNNFMGDPLSGKQSLTPVQLATLIGPKVLEPIRKSMEVMIGSKDLLDDVKAGRIYFEIVAAHLFIFTDLFYRSCPDWEHAPQVYSAYGSYIAVAMSKDPEFKFDYTELAQRFKARGNEYLPVLTEEPKGGYYKFAKLYCRNAGIDDDNIADQLRWIRFASKSYDEDLASLWREVQPVFEK